MERFETADSKVMVNSSSDMYSRYDWESAFPNAVALKSPFEKVPKSRSPPTVRATVRATVKPTPLELSALTEAWLANVIPANVGGGRPNAVNAVA